MDAITPYGQKHADLIYNLLFCDDPSLFTTTASPWHKLFQDSSDPKEIQALADDETRDSRMRYLAFNWLRRNRWARTQRKAPGDNRRDGSNPWTRCDCRFPRRKCALYKLHGKASHIRWGSTLKRGVGSKRPVKCVAAGRRSNRTLGQTETSGTSQRERSHDVLGF